MQIEVACKSCGGTGKTPLEESLAETLPLIPRKGATAQWLAASARCANISPNAFNNRLERLRSLGLVRRERHGKFYHYFRTNNHKTK